MSDGVYPAPQCLAPGHFSCPDIIFICTLLLPLEFSFLSYRCKFFTPSFRDLLYGPPSPPSLRSGGLAHVATASLPVLFSRLRMTLPPTSQSLRTRAPARHSPLSSLARAGARCRVPVTAPLRMRTKPGTGPDPRPGSGDQSTLATPGPMAETRNSPAKSYSSRVVIHINSILRATSTSD